MRKPRIILADEAESFIQPLALKFLKELQDIVKLEIITKRTFFYDLFEKPQAADILLVSDSLWSEDIRRHDIKTICILSERRCDKSSYSEGIYYIYKYQGGVKEIYARILSVSNLEARLTVFGKKETQVVLFYSVTGGVGRTTLSLGVSSCLSQTFNRVLYINAEHFSTWQYWLDNPKPVESKTLISLSNGGRDFYQRIKPSLRCGDFYYLPPFDAALSSLGIQFSIFYDLIHTARESGEYDLIVVDTDPLLDEDKARLISLADRVVLITTDSAAAVTGMNMLMKSIDARDKEKYQVVCNVVNLDSPDRMYNGMEPAQYQVDENVGYIRNIESLGLGELGRKHDIQKIAYMII